MKRFIISCLALSSLVLFSAPEIPVLNWEIRSDWMNAKTPQTWNNVKAIGDGVADDTAALQAALGAVPAKGGTVYLPPGRYRITETIFFGTYQLDSTTRPYGYSIIGCGRDTTIVWDGPDDQPMLRLTGLFGSRIIGVQFDAASRASSCIDMGGPAFQSHNLFRHCAFKNAKQAAVMASRVKINTSCTEHRMENCLFENSGLGVYLSHFNDYDCVISGCEFRDCGIAVRTSKGNFYARDCHFERSKVADFLTFSEHTPTMRRCTSYGSSCFLVQENPHCATVIQDCHIGGFTSPEGAIIQNVVPALIFDSSIEAADGNKEAPAIAFRHSTTESLVGCNKLNPDFKLVTANNRFDGIIVGAQRVHDFSGKSQYPTSGLTPKTSFLKTEAVTAVQTDNPNAACIPGKIFDVKRDFGAKEGEADDTAAFQAAIAAAKAHGKGAMVYIPHGHYTVRKTLELDGDDWYFGGSGQESILSWYGENDGVLLHVKSPKALGVIDLQLMSMGNRRSGKDLLHTGGGADESYTLYDNVRGYGWLVADPDIRGMHFEGLGAHDVVHSRCTFGNMVFNDCAAATVLIDNHYEGAQHIKGAGTNRSGIIAYQFALLEICNPCLWIEDNNSLVMTDFYNEQCTTLYRFEGNGTLPRGRLSLGSIKVEDRPRIVNGFHGQITLLYPQYYKNTLNGVSVWTTPNDADVDYLEVASYYYHHSLEWPKDGSFRARFLATGGSNAKTESFEQFMSNHADASIDEIRKQFQATLDDFRRVGLLDLQLNYSIKR